MTTVVDTQRRARLGATTALSTALVGSLTMLCAPIARAQDSGAPCVMVGQACNISSTGSPGPNGADGGFDEPGKDGTAGGPGADITTNLQDARTLQSSGDISPVNIASFGGTGGQGGDGDPGLGLANNRGGNGKPGGAGGTLNVTIGSALTGSAFDGPVGVLVNGVTIESTGGEGGAAGVASYEYGGIGNGAAGMGGNGGGITATVGGTFNTNTGDGLHVASTGGTGGRGRDSDAAGKSPQGPDGANGGAGGAVNVTVTGDFAGNDYGVFIVSQGGDGGHGGAGYSSSGGQGGNGANGGIGGAVTATLASGATAESTYNNGAAFYAASTGGVGGAGGGGSAAGDAGTGNDGGAVTAVIDGNAYGSGYGNTYGVLVQSVGGAGGAGGHSGSWFNPISGNGSSGGQGNTVNVTGTGANVIVGSSSTNNDNSAGVVAQSIGGGGGVGPNSNGWFAIGGNGGAGANAGAVSVALTGTTVATFGFNSAGVLAQSIGGGGGKGGDATGDGVIVNLVLGGTGASGGDAEDVDAEMLGFSTISTINKHSAGLELQSIGGGGGSGGAGYGKSFSAFYGAQITLGGSGGAGGDGGTVNAAHTENNQGRILTFDSDSDGIVGQSIGGGGGDGGASTAKSIVQAGDDFPGLSLTMAYGGTGGAGGSGNAVYLQNSGLVSTIGAGSSGIVAQSIGGGGGIGGDASASSSALDGGYNLAVSLAFGGKGSNAGNGGDAAAVNNGLVLTTGESADGMIVQSIGGGGGDGGGGDAKSSASADKSVSVSIAMGGASGGGGDGANVTATNTGSILSLGDGAVGMLAQSVGGGGGRAGGGSNSNNGTIQLGAQVGGNGGKGGSAGTVMVTNVGTILTYGADATGILAQSIGGGGGDGGKAGTSLGSAKSTGDGGNNGGADVLNSALIAIENDYASKGPAAISDYTGIANLLQQANNLLGNAPSPSVSDETTADDLDDTAESGGKTDDDNKPTSISINVAVGGKGGTGGSGGYINVTNSGEVATTGAMSDAIVAQSVGGGGGKGGAASTASTTDLSGSVAVGGAGGGAGNGGEPTVDNAGAVYTVGPLAAGIIAQSIGGGGGIGGASATSSKNSSGDSSNDSTPSLSLDVSVGGNGGKDGVSGAATIYSSAAIVTLGHDSTGIIGQSIAGGGGIVKTLATDLDNAGGKATSSSSKDYDIPFKFGGASGATGESGAVLITTSIGGTISTQGDDSYGILAQSISGGGGLALGGKPDGDSGSDFFGSGTMSGSVKAGLSTNPDDNEGVQVTVGDNITTSGKGAIGVLAQSIGGGGGLAGDTGWTEQFTSFGSSSNHNGSGGAIAIDVQAAATISTSGDNAPAIFVQSVGGGGGRVTNKNGAYIGSAGGTGQGGPVTIQVDGVVEATGQASLGIFAQSVGDKTSDSPIAITVGSTGLVSGGPLFNGAGDTTPGIYVDHGGMSAATPNTVTNNGTVTSVGADAGTAVYSNAGYTDVVNNGTMTGAVHLANGGGNGNFINNGTYNGGSSVDVGVTNSGTIVLPSASPTVFAGNFTQASSGLLVVQNDASTGKTGLLQVDGAATVGGQIQLNATPTHKTAPVTVLTAAGGITLPTDPGLSAARATQVFTNDLSVSGSTLQLTTNAHFDTLSAGLGKTEQTVGGYLQEVWNSGQSIGGGFVKLAGLQGGTAGFSSSLVNLSGQTLGAIAATRYRAGQTFVNNMFGGCPDKEENGRCVWGSFSDSTTDRNSTTDVLGYHLSEQTYQFGAQAPVGRDLYLGGSFAYQHATLNDNAGLATIQGDNFMGGATLAWRPGQWRIAGGVDVGAGSYGSTRQITVAGQTATSTASPSFYDAGVHLRVGYDMPLGRTWDLQPYASGHIRWAHGDAYSETGTSDFNLAVQSESHTELSADVGARLRGSFALPHQLTLHPYVSAAVEGLDGSDWAAQARFVGDTMTNGFKVSTPLPSALGEFAAGIDLTHGAKWSLKAQYSRDEGKDFTDQTWSIRFGLAF